MTPRVFPLPYPSPGMAPGPLRCRGRSHVPDWRPLLKCLLPSQNCFELYIPDNKDQVIKACKTEADGRVVEGNHTVYRISAPTPEEKEEWIKCIK